MTTRPGYIWSGTEWVEIGQSAVIAPIAYQASAPSTPATGDIWIDSDDDVPSVDSTLYYRWTKTMSGGETSLSGTDDNSLSLQYTPGYESVFINGVLQVRNLDYTATSGSTISGLTALASNDIVMVESIVAYSVGDTYTQSQIVSLLDAKSPVSTTGLVLISSTTIGSAVSSVVVNNAFSATYENYLITVSDGVASGSQYLNLQLGATTTGYRASGSYVAYNSTTVNGHNNNNTANWTNVVGGTTSSLHGIITLTSPNLAKNTHMSFSSSQSVNIGSSFTGAGYLGDTTQYTGFTLISPGTITGGTIKVYGYK